MLCHKVSGFLFPSTGKQLHWKSKSGKLKISYANCLVLALRYSSVTLNACNIAPMFTKNTVEHVISKSLSPCISYVLHPLIGTMLWRLKKRTCDSKGLPNVFIIHYNIDGWDMQSCSRQSFCHIILNRQGKRSCIWMRKVF